MKKAVLSLSGGLDSTSLLIHLLANDYQVKAFSFQYGQSHSVELERAQKNVDFLMKKFPNQLLSYRVLDLVSVFEDSESSLTSSKPVPEGHYAEGNMKDTVVENRNAIFSSIIYGKALSWANKTKEDTVICLGIHAGDFFVYFDCRQEFRDKILEAFQVGNDNGKAVGYYTPFLEGNKTTILEECLINCEKLGLDFDTILANTNTSYNPDEFGRASGKSGADIERIEAFINIGRKDPVEYQDTWENVVKHAQEVLSIT
jgi:7-cyano-7-deazaguanine synthase